MCLLTGVRRDRRQWRPEIAELQAIVFTFEVVEVKGYEVVEIESDCLEAVSQIRQETSSLTEEGGLCEEIRAKAQRLGQIKWCFAKRGCNIK
ncbi:unnamed protein product [Linum trigynum]|uniref:RNase H type-1 domain-containing protein n=1 Tax=Linum trigynum TaxID=586398 RepID=A0AAV2DK66_9ROSI